jgi:chromosome segregation ATPase
LAKLLKILAASVGGGLVLGAGIRLGGAMAAQHPALRMEGGDKLAERLGEMEERLLSLEAENPAAIVSRFEKQAAEVSAVRTRLDTDGRQIEALSETSRRLRAELRDWLEESVAARMAEVETRLQTESERGQKHVLDAFTESVQTRVIHRISRLEEEVASQSAAMGELRECSLRTELSVQKLLGGLDRLILKESPAASEEAVNPLAADAGSITAKVSAPLVETSPENTQRESAPQPGASEVVEPPAFEVHRKPRRWKIFG